eukprot:COSAG01_NODE_5219_length_4404_cov_19.378397_2_plen_107_part_00
MSDLAIPCLSVLLAAATGLSGGQQTAPERAGRRRASIDAGLASLAAVQVASARHAETKARQEAMGAMAEAGQEEEEGEPEPEAVEEGTPPEAGATVGGKVDDDECL